jgi:hypothetical protein
MSTVLMSVEGVLRKDNKDPINDGFMLFRTLVANYRIVLSTSSTPEEIDHWLKTNFLFDYATVLSDKDSYEDQPLKLRHLELARKNGKVVLFIDSDPDMCAEALSQSITSILFSSPSYFPSHREVRPWDVIAAEQIKQKQKIAERYSTYVNSEGVRFE